MLLRIIITLLVALQMLVPPGMCVCQFVPHRDADSSPAAGDDSDLSISTCCCCPESTATSAVSAAQSPQDATRHDDEGRHHGDPCNPGRQPHLPSCPALLPADHAKVAETSAPLAAPLTILAYTPRPGVASGPGTALATEAETGPPALPLYLTLRTLRI